MILISPAFGGGEKKSHDVRPHFVALDIEHHLQSMEFGDFSFIGNGPDGFMRIGVELKTVEDFVGSMQSGRLTGHQLPGLTQAYHRAYLVLQGVYKVDRKSGLLLVPRGRLWRPLHLGSRPVFWADVERFITGLEEAGIRMRYTRSSWETSQMIGRVLEPFWDKPYDDHKSFQVLYVPPPLRLAREDPVTYRMRVVAKAFDKIGGARTKAVAAKFDSIHDMINATRDEWAEIEGIGPGIAGEVWGAIRARKPTTVSQSGTADRVRRASRARAHTRLR